MKCKCGNECWGKGACSECLKRQDEIDESIRKQFKEEDTPLMWEQSGEQNSRAAERQSGKGEEKQ